MITFSLCENITKKNPSGKKLFLVGTKCLVWLGSCLLLLFILKQKSPKTKGIITEFDTCLNNCFHNSANIFTLKSFIWEIHTLSFPNYSAIGVSCKTLNKNISYFQDLTAVILIKIKIYSPFPRFTLANDFCFQYFLR